jgi:hypothetical protein
LELSGAAGAGSYGVSDCVVVVSLELEEGRITTVGGLATVLVVTVLLLKLGAAGMVETVLSYSVLVWHHALPARPTAIPIAAAETHKVGDFISSVLLCVECSTRACDTQSLLALSSVAITSMANILSVHRYFVKGQCNGICS